LDAESRGKIGEEITSFLVSSTELELDSQGDISVDFEDELLKIKYMPE